MPDSAFSRLQRCRSQAPKLTDRRLRTRALQLAASCFADRQAARALRGAAFFGFRSANSKPTLPLSNLRCAENGRPFLEINFGSRSVFPVAISFWTCSFGISRCKIVLLMRNVQVFSFETAFSQA